MTAIAVHVVDDDVITASDGHTIILVDNDTVTNFRVVG